MIDHAQTPLEALSEIALTINSIQDPDLLLENILQIAMDTLQAERGFVLLKDPGEPHGFAIRNSNNVSEKQIVDLMELSTSVVAEVFEKGEPIILFEALEDQRYGTSESIVLQQIQSIACMPLCIKDHQIGAIYLDSVSRRSHFTKESLPFLSALANQSAIAIENVRLYQSLRDENRRLRGEIKRIHGFDEIIGQSVRMQQIFETMSRLLDTDATLLLEGESGTGKELVARAIHYNGLRKDKPFITLFCGSLPDSLLESELFGHKKGAFTGAATDKPGLFESADEGTIFLDEVGDLTPRIQTALLRVLQEGEVKRVGENNIRKVDVRVISATNKPLKELIKAGEFREDLYYRLNTISITLPPLRHRKSDIPLLAHHFLDRFAVKQRNYIKGFTQDVVSALERYNWPGNVRELENTVRRAVVLTTSELITVDDLKLPQQIEDDALEPGITLKEAERRLVEKTLAEFDGNISESSRVLGVSRSWLHYKMKEWGIQKK